MTKAEALKEIGGRSGWLGADEVGINYEYAYYHKRPLTTYAYRLGTQEQNEKAAEFLASITGAKKVTVAKTQALKNRKAVREYWRSYLKDGHIMAWLFAGTGGDVAGDIWMEYEPQGQSSKAYGDDRKVIHQFGDVRRAHGELPAHITLKNFTAELGISGYLG